MAELRKIEENLLFLCPTSTLAILIIMNRFLIVLLLVTVIYAVGTHGGVRRPKFPLENKPPTPVDPPVGPVKNPIVGGAPLPPLPLPLPIGKPPSGNPPLGNPPSDPSPDAQREIGKLAIDFVRRILEVLGVPIPSSSITSSPPTTTGSSTGSSSTSTTTPAPTTDDEP